MPDGQIIVTGAGLDEETHPGRQAWRPEEVARLIGAILDEPIPFLTGETIHLDGGQGMNH